MPFLMAVGHIIRNWGKYETCIILSTIKVSSPEHVTNQIMRRLTNDKR